MDLMLHTKLQGTHTVGEPFLSSDCISIMRLVFFPARGRTSLVRLEGKRPTCVHDYISQLCNSKQASILVSWKILGIEY